MIRSRERIAFVMPAAEAELIDTIETSYENHGACSSLSKFDMSWDPIAQNAFAFAFRYQT